MIDTVRFMGESVGSVTTPPRLAPSGAEAQRAARRTLRRQIAHLEAELGAAVLASFEARGRGEGSRPPARPAGVGARLLDLGELEVVRDGLVRRLRAVEHENAQRSAAQRVKRAELQAMLLAPGHHRFTRISCAELGEPGCGVWRVRPRLGVIGMLAGWWQVTLSSGCPLPRRR